MLIVDPRCRTGQSNSIAMSRHGQYAEALSKINTGPPLKLVILQPYFQGLSKSEKISENLSIVRARMILKGFLFNPSQVRSLFEEFELHPVVLVAGDPDISFVNSKLIQRFYSAKRVKKVPIQVQVHSELSKNYSRGGLRQSLKYSFAKISLNLADSVRATSLRQSKNLVSNFKIEPNKIVAIPVPLTIDFSKILIQADNRPLSIGFIGRLQKERNLDLLVKILRTLKSKIPELEVIIIGDGYEKSSLDLAISKFIESPRVKFLGNLDREALNDAWKQIGVLVSTAKSESYGRAIRESLCHGIPVLAHESLGVSSLLEENMTDWVSIIKFPLNADEVAQQFMSLLNLRTNDSYLEFQKHKQSTLHEELANSWIRMTI